MPTNKINAIKVWEIFEKGVLETSLPDTSNLDAVTRQLAQGFYTTFRTYDGGKRVLGLHVHLQRLYQPMAGQQGKASVSVDSLRQRLSAILQAYPDEARVRLVMTAKGQVYIAIEPLKPLPPETYLRGVKVVTTGMQRQTPRLKSTAFISASQGTRNNLAGSQVFEALLVRNGYILEGMTSNFFYICEGRLGTARRDILLGVTRRTVLRVARGSGLDILYKPLKREQIPALSEAFLTSSSRGIVPIVQVDDMAVGQGSPGEITHMLMEGYKSYVLRLAERIYPG